ncbi:MAG: hypothetical protein AABW88_03235 [Nanoarchaeota archaeon]
MGLTTEELTEAIKKRTYLTEAVELDQIIGVSKRTLDFNEDQARELLKEMLVQPLLPPEREQIDEYVVKYAVCWFIKRFNERYAQLDPSIFELNRSIKVDSHDTASFPALFSVEVEKEHGGIVTHRHQETKYHNGYDIKVQVPQIPREARIEYCKARAFNHQLIGQAFNDILLARIMTEYPRILTRQVNGVFRMIWAPEQVEVTKVAPVPRDPAIIFDLPYTEEKEGPGPSIPRIVHQIYKWDAPGERDLEGMLHEFTTSFPKAIINRV